MMPYFKTLPAYAGKVYNYSQTTVQFQFKPLIIFYFQRLSRSSTTRNVENKKEVLRKLLRNLKYEAL
jgi:hypothetical protein